MYSKEQASSIRESFWKAFGRYMALQYSAEGLKINWINYKTGIRYLSFKMQADNRTACVMIELSHPDSGIRELMFEQLLSQQVIFDRYLDGVWQWQREATDDYGKATGRVRQRLEGVSIFREEDWPVLVSFFKKGIMGLDSFWSEAQYGFELFR